MTHQPASRRSRMRARASKILAPSVQPSRLMLAGKTALAAGIAWYLGRLPDGIDEYSYYAPMGALIVMMPTVMGSVRSTVQTLIGLILGVLLALGVILSPLPGVVNVALAVGIGVLLGGLGGLGTGRDWVPIAALFVLVIGGSDADTYSFAYLVQMAMGMGVGIIVNLAVFPPLWLRESSSSVGSVRRGLADLLDDAAKRLADDESPVDAPMMQLTQLEWGIRESEQLVAEAAESRRLNPRARKRTHAEQIDSRDVAALTRLLAHARDLLDDVTEAEDGQGWRATEQGMRRVATALRRWDDPSEGTTDDTDQPPSPERAPDTREHSDPTVTTTATLQRMLRLIEARIHASR